VIPDLSAIAERFGVNPSFAPLVFAALLTALVLFFQSIARWFEDWNP
jgi:hypothetical protein